MPTIECVTPETRSNVNFESSDVNLMYLDAYDMQCAPGCCIPVED